MCGNREETDWSDYSGNKGGLRDPHKYRLPDHSLKVRDWLLLDSCKVQAPRSQFEGERLAASRLLYELRWAEFPPSSARLALYPN